MDHVCANREEIKEKLRDNFSGKIVRKDLTKKIKEGANVPVYVLEFLLGQYCGSDDEEIIEQGVEKVKKILADNFVRPDEAQKTLSVLRQKGDFYIYIHIVLRQKDCIEYDNVVKRIKSLEDKIVIIYTCIIVNN